MEHEELTRHIIGCAYRVFNTMGRGFLESVYENCMLTELRKLGLQVSNQHPIKVYYHGHVVRNFEADNFEADLFVQSAVIVELKAVAALVKIHDSRSSTCELPQGYRHRRRSAPQLRRADG